MKTFEAALSLLDDLIRSVGTHVSPPDESGSFFDPTISHLQEALAHTKALSDKNGSTRVSIELENFEKLIWREASGRRIFQLQKFFKLFADRLQALAKRAPSIKKRVLIIEDSQVTQLLLKKFLTTPDLEVVGVSAKEEEVFQLLEKTCPDVITLDIFLGGANGFALLEKILNKYPIPVVLISSIQSSAGIQVFHALYRGCLDFIPKVSLTQGLDREAFCQRITKAAQTSMASLAKYYCDPTPFILKGPLAINKTLAIGVAAGGTRSLIDLMTLLPKEFPPILIDQRVAPEFTAQLILLLQEVCSFDIRVASEGEEVKANTVLLAPAGKVLSVVVSTSDSSLDAPMRIHLLDSANTHADSDEESPGESPLNVFFQSFAHAIAQNKNSTGLLLGGYGHDGATGLAAIRREGGLTIVEDEYSSYDPTLARETLLIQGAVMGTKSEFIPEVVLKALSAAPAPAPKSSPAYLKSPQGVTQSQTLEPGPVPEPKNELKVLIVDDSPTIRAILRHGLQSLGIADCYEAESGAGAWSLIQKLVAQGLTLDLIISDQNMPGMTGKDLLNRVREDARVKTVPFILATAETDQNQVLDAMKKGVTDYITKPVSLALFKKKLQAVLGISS